MQLYLAIDYNLTENRQYKRHILRYICRHTPPYIFIWIFNVVSPPYLLSFLTFVAASNFLASSFGLYTQQSIFFYHFIMINDVPFHLKYRVQNGFYCSATLQLLLNSHQIRNFSLFRSSVNFHLWYAYWELPPGLFPSDPSSSAPTMSSSLDDSFTGSNWNMNKSHKYLAELPELAFHSIPPPTVVSYQNERVFYQNESCRLHPP